MALAKKAWIYLQKLRGSTFNYQEPNFFVIGAMKSGTTALWQYLITHPEISATKLKEPCFFSYKNINGYWWYIKQFPKKHKNMSTLSFDSSPVYLHDPRSAKRLSQYFPDTKIIVVIRDPIERAVSHYNYYSDPNSRFAKLNPADRLEKRDISTAFYEDMAGRENRTFYKYCSMSRYHKQINTFLEHFKKNQFVIVNQSLLKHSTQNTLYKILNFIGVQETLFFNEFDSSDEQINGVESLKNTKLTGKLKQFNSQTYKYKLPNSLEEDMIKYFKKDVQLLKEQWNINFDWMDKYLD